MDSTVVLVLMVCQTEFKEFVRADRRPAEWTVQARHDDRASSCRKGTWILLPPTDEAAGYERERSILCIDPSVWLLHAGTACNFVTQAAGTTEMGRQRFSRKRRGRPRVEKQGESDADVSVTNERACVEVWFSIDS